MVLGGTLVPVSVICRFKPDGDTWNLGQVPGVTRRSSSPLTGVVPATTGGAPSPPAAFKHSGVPEADGVLTEGVWGQITDLQPGELVQEVLEGHPGRQTVRQTDR